MTRKNSIHTSKTILLTSLALIAFAANSVLCKMALGSMAIDASGFTVIRLLSGAIVLFIILKTKKLKNSTLKNGKWFGSILLFTYAIAFSYAYISLDTGTGALILFAAVQITIILSSIISGNRLHLLEWAGLLVSFIGFIYLILPGINTPSLTGFILMTIAGVAWGFYTILGKKSSNAIADTAYNFIKTIPWILFLLIFTYDQVDYSFKGIILAIISGAITSGLGYAIWYMALGGLSSIQAAVVQLLVPVIAAFGGVIFIAEKITYRLSISSILILGGILIVVLGRKSESQIK